MISKADAIVIGSGGLGAATAYYLSQRKGLSAVLTDKHDIKGSLEITLRRLDQGSTMAL